jgi:ferredoxin-fold anticodon binding domain-containing protein
MDKKKQDKKVSITEVSILSNEEYAKLKNDSLELQIIKSGKSVSYKRHVLKAVSYRALGSLQTCLISYFFTGNF